MLSKSQVHEYKTPDPSALDFSLLHKTGCPGAHEPTIPLPFHYSGRDAFKIWLDCICQRIFLSFYTTFLHKNELPPQYAMGICFLIFQCNHSISGFLALTSSIASLPVINSTSIAVTPHCARSISI